MEHASTPSFLTFHALRIKGFASADTLAEMTGLAPRDVDVHLDDLAADGHAVHHERRGVWRLTPEGKQSHQHDLEARLAAVVTRNGGTAVAHSDVDVRAGTDQRRGTDGDRPSPTHVVTTTPRDTAGDPRTAVDFVRAYEEFLELDSEFKSLCGVWQLRDGRPNDHSDPTYDRAVIDDLVGLHGRAHPLVAAIGRHAEHLRRYAPRLDDVLARILAGESNMFTGVRCGSYHDVWMELHEDLLLTTGVANSLRSVVEGSA